LASVGERAAGAVQILTSRSLFDRAVAARQYLQVLQFGNILIADRSATAEDLAQMGAAYLASRDCGNAVAMTASARAMLRENGVTPSEQFYLTDLQCAVYVRDDVTVIATLQALIRISDKNEYWNSLLVQLRADARDSHERLMLERLLHLTHASTVISDYLELAQHLLDAQRPAEAREVLELMPDMRLLAADRYNMLTALQLRNMAMLSANFDSESRARIIEQAGRDATGETDLTLGTIYYGLGDYPSALDSLQLALLKGNLQYPDEAILYLGLAHSALRHHADSKAAFEQLAELKSSSRNLRDAWRLYSDQRAW
jgi:hypothetical protein